MIEKNFPATMRTDDNNTNMEATMTATATKTTASLKTKPAAPSEPFADLIRELNNLRERVEMGAQKLTSKRTTKAQRAEIVAAFLEVKAAADILKEAQDVAFERVMQVCPDNDILDVDGAMYQIVNRRGESKQYSKVMKMLMASDLVDDNARAQVDLWLDETKTTPRQRSVKKLG